MANLTPVATSVTNPSTFSVDQSNDFTLEVNGTANTLIKISNGATVYEYAPTSTSTVRFVKRGAIVYVYENNVYKTTVNSNVVLSFPAIRQAVDDSVNKAGVYSPLNLIANPGFQKRVAQGTSTTHYKDGIYWNAYNQSKALDWGTGSTAAIRSLAPYYSEGTYSIIMHGTTRYLTQKLGDLKPNTYYQINYDYWTSSPASSNGGAAYNILLGTTQFGGDLTTLAGHTTSLTETTKKTFSGMFKTPASLSGTDIWLTLYRSVSKVDWIDRVSLLEETTTNASAGIEGVSGSALYVAGTAYAPAVTLNTAAGDHFEMTQFVVNPSFESSFTGWSNNGMATQTNTSFSTFKNGNTYIEKWVSAPPLPDVSLTQTITGLPNGTYTLKLAAHNITQTPLSGKPGAFAFANSSNKAITDRNDYSFDFLVLDGTAAIGFKTVNSQGNWAALDNFRLQYKGFVVQSVKDSLQALKDSTSIILAKKMQNAVRTALTNAIDAAQEAINNPTIGNNELASVFIQLQNAANSATISITAYHELQTGIDSAIAVYGNGGGNRADSLLASIQRNQTLVANFETTLASINEGRNDIYQAIYSYRLANASGPAPVVTTNPNFARGATKAFGRSTISGIPVAELLEHGFCWSTSPEPSIFDNKTTKYFSNKGYIYRMEDLQPATVYYMRAYAISKSYVVGYGSVIKVITIPKGTVTYQLNSSVTNSGEHHPRIASAMESAVNYFNNLTSIQGHHLKVNYNAGTPTAEASYGGYMQFGANASYQKTGTALHEMGHTIGVGQHSVWYGPNSPLRATGSGGAWLGERANKVVQFLENDPGEYMRGDGVHMWPYGVNGAHEDTGSELLYTGNALIHQALGEDGLPPTGGFATPANTFIYNDTAKYYIKIEDAKMGRNTTFLVENASGQLSNKTMSPTGALAIDSAAWYFKFIPATGYYQIRNAATGKYFTYQASGENGITLTSVSTTAPSNSFQLMGARYTTLIGEEGEGFTVKAYSIVRPEAKLSPPCLAANSNGTTSAVAFNNRNEATTQHWLLLSEADVNSFAGVLNKIPAVVKNPRIASGDSKITLTWDSQYHARYEISRSETETGSYSVIAANLDALRFVDNGRQNGSTYYYKIVALNDAGRSAESAILSGTPMPGRHLHVSFDENNGNNAYDSWGGYHASLYNGAKWTIGQDSSNAVNLIKSSNSYMQLHEGVVSELNDFTIASWFKMPANQGNNTRLFDFGSGTGTYMSFVPKYNASTIRYQIIRSDIGKSYDKIIPYVIPLNQWVHVAMSQKGSAFKLYVNGQVIFTDNTASVKPSDLGITTQNYLGRSQWPSDPYSDHSYGDFRIYNYVLTDQNVQALANNQAIPECSIPTFSSPENIITSTSATSCDTVINYSVKANGYPASNLTYSFTGATTGSGDGTGSGSTFNKGTTTVTIAATNSCGAAEYSFDITVIDSINPLITAPNNVAIGTNDACTATQVALGTPIVKDNCSDSNDLTVSNDAPGVFPVGKTTVTWTVSDAAGNSQTATQIVTVTDNEKPVPSAPPTQAFCYNGNTYTVPELTADDNCGVASVSYSITGATSRSGSGTNASGSFNVGVSTITWTVTDRNNNEATGTTTVTVNAPLTVSIPDVYAVNLTTDNKNTLYKGYGPTSLTLNTTPTGGTGTTYNYNWSTGETSTSIVVNTAGTYNVTITDDAGCTAIASITIHMIDVTCGNNSDKVMVCHNGKTICVASSAVQEHLDHGDYLGSCTTNSVSVISAAAPIEAIIIETPEMSVYPNPSKGQFSVHLNGNKSGKASITVLDMNGRIVAQKEVLLTGESQDVKFDLSDHAQGIYLVKVVGVEGAKTHKVIVQ
jgi:hypothetical protein